MSPTTYITIKRSVLLEARLGEHHLLPPRGRNFSSHQTESIYKTAIIYWFPCRSWGLRLPDVLRHHIVRNDVQIYPPSIISHQHMRRSIPTANYLNLPSSSKQNLLTPSALQRDSHRERLARPTFSHRSWRSRFPHHLGLWQKAKLVSHIKHYH